MIKVSDIDDAKVKRYVKLMSVAGTGCGKTHLAATFPKCYFLITEPEGQETFLTNSELKKNVVGYDLFIPMNSEDTKKVFEDLDKACDKAREMALSGEIETVVVDNFTYLAENRWMYINKYETLYSAKTGEVDTRGMYGSLARWLYQFTLMKILSLPCNVVVNVHEKMESDEAMAKKPDKSNPIVPSVLGGFRDDMGGMFSCIFYLAKIPTGGGKYKYMARTNLGQGKLGKNRYGLPEVIENVSYATIAKAIADSLVLTKKGV